MRRAEHHPLGRAERRPARHDGKAKPGGDKADDCVLFLGHLRDARGMSGLMHQLDGKIMAVRARRAVGHDQGRIGQIGDLQAVVTGQIMPRRQRHHRAFRQERAQLDARVAPFGRADQRQIDPP